MLNHTKRQGNIKMTTMFITAVCIVFFRNQEQMECVSENFKAKTGK